VAKRQAVSQAVHMFKMVEEANMARFEFNGFLESNLSEPEADIMLLLKATGGEYSIKEIRDKIGNKWGEPAMRKACTSLERKGSVVMAREQHNMFRYRLNRAKTISLPEEPLEVQFTSQINDQDLQFGPNGDEQLVDSTSPNTT
jgi:hypothetical protein